jgi:hypothetical protein
VTVSDLKILFKGVLNLNIKASIVSSHRPWLAHSLQAKALSSAVIMGIEFKKLLNDNINTILNRFLRGQIVFAHYSL